MEFRIVFPNSQEGLLEQDRYTLAGHGLAVANVSWLDPIQFSNTDVKSVFESVQLW
jgi:hypothetical protein